MLGATRNESPLIPVRDSCQVDLAVRSLLEMLLACRIELVTSIVIGLLSDILRRAHTLAFLLDRRRLMGGSCVLHRILHLMYS